MSTTSGVPFLEIAKKAFEVEETELTVPYRASGVTLYSLTIFDSIVN